jgi:hypothetical protein
MLTTRGFALPATFCVQVRGRSRVVLIAPGATFPGLYPYPVAHPYDRYACVQVDDPDYGAWPALASVRGDVAILAPGDLLLIPRLWWAHIESLGGEDAAADTAAAAASAAAASAASASQAHRGAAASAAAVSAAAAAAAAAASGEHTLLELTFAPGGRARTPGQASLATSRRVEELAASLLPSGAAGARALLLWVASGRDLTPSDELHTPGGYAKLRLATALRDEVADALCVHPLEAGTFLRGLTDARLLPTPWLNAAFREPLYLTDVPVRVPDTRSEWERRFPELFTRKLTAEGYAPAATPVSVMNPMHPGFIGRAAAQ